MNLPCPVCQGGHLVEYCETEDTLAARMCAVLTPTGDYAEGCGAVYLRLGETWGRWLPDVTPEALAFPSVRRLRPSPSAA